MLYYGVMRVEYMVYLCVLALLGCRKNMRRHKEEDAEREKNNEMERWCNRERKSKIEQYRGRESKIEQ